MLLGSSEIPIYKITEAESPEYRRSWISFKNELKLNEIFAYTQHIGMT